MFTYSFSQLLQVVSLCLNRTGNKQHNKINRKLMWLFILTLQIFEYIYIYKHKIREIFTFSINTAVFVLLWPVFLQFHFCSHFSFITCVCFCVCVCVCVCMQIRTAYKKHWFRTHVYMVLKCGHFGKYIRISGMFWNEVWRGREKINWADRVKHKILRRVNVARNILNKLATSWVRTL